LDQRAEAAVVQRLIGQAGASFARGHDAQRVVAGAADDRLGTGGTRLHADDDGLDAADRGFLLVQVFGVAVLEDFLNVLRIETFEQRVSDDGFERGLDRLSGVLDAAQLDRDSEFFFDVSQCSVDCCANVGQIVFVEGGQFGHGLLS